MVSSPLPENSRPSEVLPPARCWAVAWTVAHGERVLEQFLQRQGVPTFVPKVTRRRVHKSGAKTWSAVLFPGYVFFDSEVIDRSRVLATKKVAQILMPPDPEELRRELTHLALAIVCDASLRQSRFGHPGRQVNVVRGPLKGLSGELVHIGAQSRLLLRVSFLGQAAELLIDEAFVEPAL